ncbi:MAG: transcription termination/antitermination protein NusG [Paludibacteraceae bacterium]|nr:transcription termination/antitermination factor NusG [Candidatus Physcocola equi]MCQ2234575.1 transcription termination/antitermination protein NusG [Paludibacteraceae bacterium]
MANSQEQSLGLRWYVLRAISGKENKVKEYLDAEIKNGHFGKAVSQVLVPTEKTFVMRNGKKVLKERNCLPGYVLVQADLSGDAAFRLTSSPNVLGFLTEGTTPANSKPAPIQDSEAMRMLGQSEVVNGDFDEVEVDFDIDQVVKVIDGPFNGFTGKVEEVNKDRKKLKVSVTIFGRKTPLELDFIQVEKKS